MDRVSKTLRAGSVFVVAVCALAASFGAGHAAIGAAGLASSRATFDAAALVPTLPPVLSAPAVPSGPQLVAMVAKDIDADGDLDVVANDTALHLLVWINDGTGRLTRREARHPAGLLPEASGSGLASEPDGPESIVHVVGSFVQPHAAVGLTLPEYTRSGADGMPPAPRSAFLAHRAPRAPPVLVS